jgi:hypothetical protein
LLSGLLPRFFSKLPSVAGVEKLRNMTSSDEVLAQLNKWHKGSTKLLMTWAISGAHGWCVGVVKHPHNDMSFGIESVDEKDFLFWLNIHPTYHPRFRFLDARDGIPFFSPYNDRGRFGKILEISLHVDAQTGESEGRVVLAEFFEATIDV